MKVLAISGSLRAASLNSLLLRAVARIAPASMQVQLYGQLGYLPLFNVDLEASAPEPVEKLRAAINGAAAVIIGSPEYAHGVSGVMKNALDWMVGNESFVNKPVALFNTSPRATIAQAALRETLQTMSGRVIDEACMTLPLMGAGLNEEDIVRDTQIRSAVVKALGALARAIEPGAR